MVKPRSHRRTLTISAEAFQELAAEVVAGHEGWIGSGYDLTAGSRLWRCKDGTWTGRFVYRNRGQSVSTITFVVSGMAPA